MRCIAVQFCVGQFSNLQNCGEQERPALVSHLLWAWASYGSTSRRLPNGCTMRVLLCIGIAFVVLGVVAFVLPLSDEPQHGAVPLFDSPATMVSDTDTTSIVVGTLLVSAG